LRPAACCAAASGVALLAYWCCGIDVTAWLVWLGKFQESKCQYAFYRLNIGVGAAHGSRFWLCRCSTGPST
jgi:hypothetical protein